MELLLSVIGQVMSISANDCCDTCNLAGAAAAEMGIDISEIEKRLVYYTTLDLSL